MSSIYSNDSDALVTPTSEFESPFSHKRSSSNDAQEVRHPRFPDLTGRRGSAAGQHDLVIQAQKGLGPTIRTGQRFNPGPKATSQYDLQTQSRYGHGPTVSLREPAVERRGSSAQHDLITQAVYGHGPTVPISQPLTESRRSDTQYDLATQAPHAHGDKINLRNPYGNKKTYESHDLSSQYRKFL